MDLKRLRIKVTLEVVSGIVFIDTEGEVK